MNHKLKGPISEINEIIEEISKDSDNLGGYIVFDRIAGSMEFSGIVSIIIKPPQKTKRIKSKIKNESQMFDITDSAFFKRDFIESKALSDICNYCLLNRQYYLVQTPVVIGRLKKFSNNLQKGYLISQFLKYNLKDPNKPQIKISIENEDTFIAIIQIIDLKEAGLAIEEVEVNNGEAMVQNGRVSVGFMDQQRRAFIKDKQTKQQMTDEIEKLNQVITEKDKIIETASNSLSHKIEELNKTKENLKISEETIIRNDAKKFDRKEEENQEIKEKFERKEEEERKKEQQKRFEKIEKMLKVSSKIRLDIMRKTLKMDEEIFLDRIWDWAEKFGFKMDGDFINVEEADINGFIRDLDKQFEQWKKKDKSDKN